MTLRQDIDSFKARIAQVELKRDAWRAAGNREKYLEAYFAVEAMELLLEERLLDEQLRCDAAQATWMAPGHQPTHAAGGAVLPQPGARRRGAGLAIDADG